MMFHLDRSILLDMGETQIQSYFLGSNGLLDRLNTWQAWEDVHKFLVDKGVVLVILEDRSDQLDIYLHSLFLCHQNVDKSNLYWYCML